MQVEAGKGLEMRKLVLSGFLASEEIYINQLEALLLVSTCSGAFESLCQQGHDLKLLLELERKGDLDQSLSVGRVCGTALLTTRDQAAGVIARKVGCASQPRLFITCPGKAGLEAQSGWGWQTLHHP